MSVYLPLPRMLLVIPCFLELNSQTPLKASGSEGGGFMKLKTKEMFAQAL